MINPRKKAQLHSVRQDVGGLSLIEIMISMVIGLFLVLGATTLYVNSRKSADVDDAVARLQESARYALSVIETDVRMANYFGLLKSGSAMDNSVSNQVNNPSPLTGVLGASAQACGAQFAYDVEHYVEGSDDAYGLGCAANSGEVATADTLTIRRAATSVTAQDAGRIQACVNRINGMVITGTMTCPGTNEIHDLVVNTYYVDQQSDQSTSIPSLRRKQLGTICVGASCVPGFNDVEIIPGVEDMQIQFGWAPQSTSTALPTSGAVIYLPAGNAGLAQQNSQIVSVRIWLLVRAESRDATFTDSRQYSYGTRTGTGTTNNLNDTSAKTSKYVPSDNFRRILVSRTFFIRNVLAV